MKTVVTSMLVLLSLCVMGENKWRFTAKEKKVIGEGCFRDSGFYPEDIRQAVQGLEGCLHDNHEIRLSSRTESSKEVPEYKELVKMGDRIIPLLIQKRARILTLISSIWCRIMTFKRTRN